MSGDPSNFVVVGRPKFHETAVLNVQEIGVRENLLLITVPELVEIIIRVCEGKLSRDQLLDTLENSTGILDLN